MLRIIAVLLLQDHGNISSQFRLLEDQDDEVFLRSHQNLQWFQNVRQRALYNCTSLLNRLEWVIFAATSWLSDFILKKVSWLVGSRSRTIDFARSAKPTSTVWWHLHPKPTTRILTTNFPYWLVVVLSRLDLTGNPCFCLYCQYSLHLWCLAVHNWKQNDDHGKWWSMIR